MVEERLCGRGHVDNHILTPGSVSILPLSQKGGKEVCAGYYSSPKSPPLPHSLRLVPTLALPFIMFHWIILKLYVVPHLF